MTSLFLLDGPGTSVKDRPEAEQFKAFVRQSYPAIRQEPANKVYPIMLNVSNQGPCIELPFGASLVNRTNTYTTINALHRLIAINLAASRIGIVTLYPAQVEIYKDALDRCHKYAPDRGYNLVQVDLLENWVQKTVGIVIVDLVRTPNASGNLGYLSQANRLKVLLSLHHNGLIIVGDRTCTVTSHGTVTSAKLERILEWFVDHGRIVQMSDKGQPLPILPMAPAPTQPSPMVPLPSQKPSDSSTFRSPASSVSGLESDTPAPRRRYVGIPGLEHLKLDKPFTENTRAPIDSRGRSAAQTSYVRQGFPTRESSRSFDKPSNEEPASFVPDVNTGSQSERLHPDDYLSFARQGSSTPLDPKSVAKGGLGTFDIPTMKTKTTNKKPRDLAIATAPGKLEQASIPANLPSKTTLQGPRSRETKGGDLTPPSMDSNAHQDSDSPFRKATKRHKEEATKDGSNKTLGESSSKLSFQSGTALPASQSMPVAESPHAITGASIPLKSAGKENVPPQTAAQPSSSQPHRTKVKETSPGKSDPKLPPHKAVMRLSTQDSSISATKQQGPHKNGLPAPALRVSSPPAASSLVPHQASTSTNSSGAASKVASVSSLSAPTLVRALNFKSRYQPKYRAIRASFKNMNSDISRTPQEEDRLFRCLADAFMDEDDNAFDNAYTDLLGLSAKLQTSVLRREGDQRRLMH